MGVTFFYKPKTEENEMAVTEQDPAAELTVVALRQITATARAVEALDDIAMLERSCPLAAEVAMEALRDLKALVVDHA